MSFKVNLYSFNKRDNSTKRPSGDGTSFDCILKRGCGILNPVISLDLGLSQDPSTYNYAYIPAFDRYYFITEWFFEDRLWTAHLSVDVLATYKSQIGESTLYVLRSAGAYDGSIIDNIYPTKTGTNQHAELVSSVWDMNALYVIGVISKLANVGSLKYYVLTSSSLRNLCSYLLDDVIDGAQGYTIDGVSDSVVLNLLDPLQYIKSCVMLPISNMSDIDNLETGGTVTVLNYPAGAFGLGVGSSSRVHKSFTFDIPKHPDTNSRGNYVNSAPYTTMTLMIPPFGQFTVDTSVTCNQSTIKVDIYVDCITGIGVCLVSCGGIVLNRLEAQVGVPINLSSVTRDGSITTALSGLLEGMTAPTDGFGNKVGSGVMTGTGIGNAITAKNANVSSMGSTGSFVSLYGANRLDAQFFRPVADDITHNGRPLCQNRKINTLSGFIMVQDGDVSTRGTATEDEKIRAYLESGFYYE